MPGRVLFVPREPHAAARAVSSLVTVSAVVMIVALFVTQNVTTWTAGHWVALALCCLAPPAAWGMRRVDSATDLRWTSLPFVWIAVLVTCGSIARAPGMHVDVLLFFPAMYASRRVPRNGALTVIAVCAAAVVALAVTAPYPGSELSFALFLVPVLVGSGIRLAASGERFASTLSEMQVRASTDGLTGLGTRHTLLMAARQPWTGGGALTSSASSGQALLLFDVDHFKQINDEYGHPGGDAALVQLAQIIVQHTRPGDIACRLGGDEIAVLCRGISRETAHKRAEHLRRFVAAQDLELVSGRTAQLTISVGVAHQSRAALDFDQLYAEADRALYRAKRAGRNQVVHEAA